MVIVKQEGVSDIDQVSRADIFGIDQELSRALDGLGKLTVHSRKVFSCTVRSDAGAGIDINFDGDNCKAVVYKEGSVPVLYEALSNGVRVQKEGIERNLVIFLEDRETILVTKDSVLVQS